MLKHRDLISLLKKGTTYPLYLLFGEEELLIREAVDLIVSTIVDPAARDFNFNVLYCRDTPVAELVNLAQTLPLMAEKRLIVAKDVDAFKASDIEELMPYLNDPSPSTCLVMIANQAKYDKKNMLDAVEAHGAVVKVYPLLDGEIIPWIDAWAKARGLSLRRDASQYLWQVVGNDLQKIKNELEKVEIYMKEKKSITFDDVKTVVGDFREYSTFDLATALGQKNREKAFLILFRLIQEGEQPVGLLGSIAWHFRKLLRAKAMEEEGVGYEAIKRKLRVIFYESASFRQQMKTFTMEELCNAFEIMQRADRTLKSSSLNGRLVLERMILKLCDAS
jgi:DNA polymerase III subunit delta